MNKQKHQKIIKDTLNELNHIIEEKKDFICSCGSCDIVVSLALNFKVGHICPESFNELNNIICIDSIEKNDIEKILSEYPQTESITIGTFCESCLVGVDV